MKGSVKERRMYPFWFDFSSCSESAEIWHADSFCVKKCPCVFFFKKAEKYGPNYTKIPPPPPLAIGGGGGGERAEGGGLSRASLKPRFPACEKRNPGTFFDTKRVGMPKFLRFRET